MITIRQSLRFLVAPAVLAVAFTASAQSPIPRGKPEDVGLSTAALEKIKPAMQAFVDSNRLAGVAMAIARHGKLVYLDAVGSMDSVRTVPLRADAVFRMYSMTKPLTTVAIMQLYERGKIKLDDPVSKFIPEFANEHVYASGAAANPTLADLERPITIEHLLTHTSGLTYGAFGNTPVDTLYRQANILGANVPIEAFAQNVAKIPLLFQPGTKWNYSVALDVLGRVVEVASGKTFDRYLDDEILKPLKMEHTAFHATSAMNGNITWMFSPTSARGIRPANRLLDTDYTDEGKAFRGGQGLLSTIPDYLRFTQALLNRGELDGKRILKRETVDLMMQNHLPPALTPISAASGAGFGFGGSVQVDSTERLPARPGTFRWSGYGTTYFWIDPRSDMIGLVFAQLIPSLGAVETAFQRLVYASVISQ